MKATCLLACQWVLSFLFFSFFSSSLPYCSLASAFFPSSSTFSERFPLRGAFLRVSGPIPWLIPLLSDSAEGDGSAVSRGNSLVLSSHQAPQRRQHKNVPAAPICQLFFPTRASSVPSPLITSHLIIRDFSLLFIKPCVFERQAVFLSVLTCHFHEAMMGTAEGLGSPSPSWQSLRGAGLIPGCLLKLVAGGVR